jgi:transposase
MINMTALNNACPRCGTQRISKRGFYYSVKQNCRVQRYFCAQCNFKFSAKLVYKIDEDFEYKDKPLPKTDWEALTKAHTSEKHLVFDMLDELLSTITILPNKGKKGRKNENPKDIVFCLAIKTFNNRSSRRIACDLMEAQRRGQIEKVPHFTTLMDYLHKPCVSELLEELVRLSAMPIKQLSEQIDCAVDSTGFSTTSFGKWFDYKYGKEEERRNWIKLHAMTDTFTNVFTSVQITKSNLGDSPQLIPLVKQTTQNFSVRALSADKAYCSRENHDFCFEKNVEPYLLFKENNKENKKGSRAWKECFLFYKNYPQRYLERYHKRSNIETSFFMLKRRFGDSVLTKTFQAQKAEVLLKVLLHNLCCLCQEYYERNLNTQLATEAHKTPILAL